MISIAILRLKVLPSDSLSLLEDIRIEERIKHERPGTKHVFAKRKDMYRKHFSTQLTLNLERSIFTDALFCAIYVKLTAESPLETLPSMREDIDLMRPFIEAAALACV